MEITGKHVVLGAIAVGAVYYFFFYKKPTVATQEESAGGGGGVVIPNAGQQIQLPALGIVAVPMVSVRPRLTNVRVNAAPPVSGAGIKPVNQAISFNAPSGVNLPGSGTQTPTGGLPTGQPTL